MKNKEFHLLTNAFAVVNRGHISRLTSTQTETTLTVVRTAVLVRSAETINVTAMTCGDCKCIYMLSHAGLMIAMILILNTYFQHSRISKVIYICNQ